MRELERIDKILKLISEIWHKNPELRLCQLIGNCFSGCLDLPPGWEENPDLYYVEDDMLQNKLEELYR